MDKEREAIWELEIIWMVLVVSKEEDIGWISSRKVMLNSRACVRNSVRSNLSLVQVINFATEKTWQYPRISMDIATSKCFFCRGNFFVAIATTPNLRRKSDNVLDFVKCLIRRYIDAWPSLYPRLAVARATPFRRYIHGCWDFLKNKYFQPSL